MISRVKDYRELNIMPPKNFYAISNASTEFFVDNTRNSFTNNLPKSFEGRDNLNVALETAIFDNDFNFYKSDGSFDIMLSFEENNYFISMNKVDNLSSLVRRCNEFFAYVSDKHNNLKLIAKMFIFENKIRFEIYLGFVALTPPFFNFLNLRNSLDQHDFINDSASVRLEVLKFEVDDPITYISQADIHLNLERLDFLHICVGDIEKYPSSELTTDIISTIPLNNLSSTTYFSPSKKNFFKLESNILKSISIKFLQPNLHPVYFCFGSPNIIKMSIQSDIKNNFFYTQVSSKPTPTFMDNNNNHFQIELPKEYNLTGEWEVGVVNAFIPRPTNLIKFDTTVYKIEQGSNFFMTVQTTSTTRKKYSKFPLLEFTKRELCIFLIQEFSEYFDVYVSSEENIYLVLKRDFEQTTYTHIMTSFAIREIINSKGHLKEISNTSADVIWKDRFQEEKNQFIGDNMNAMTVSGLTIVRGFDKMRQYAKTVSHFFNARDFYNLFNVEDISIDSLNIKRLLSITDSEYLKKEEIRILKLMQNEQKIAEDHEILPSFLFIYCDFVSETIMGDRYINILKMIPYKNGVNNLPGGVYDFSRSEFYPVNKQMLKNLTFHLKTHSGSSYSYFTNESNISLTLKFQRRR